MSPQEVFISAIPIPCLGYNVSKLSKASTYPSRPLQETHPARRALTSTASSATSTEPRIYILHVPTAYATKTIPKHPQATCKILNMRPKTKPAPTVNLAN